MAGAWSPKSLTPPRTQRTAAHEDEYEDWPTPYDREDDQPDPPSMSPEYWNPPHLYHGTHAELKPGQTVEPGHGQNSHGGGTLDRRGEWAYATPHLTEAKEYAESAAVQRSGRPRVYEVGHGHEMTPDPESGYAFGGPENVSRPGWRSRRGFPVLRELAPHEIGEWDSHDWSHTASRWTPQSGIFGPTTGLDPHLFGEDGELHRQVRGAVMEKLDQCLRVDSGLAGSDWQEWLRVYLAGGSASEWAGSRPNDSAQDLDVLVGLDLAVAQGYSSFEGMDAGQAATALNAAFRHCFNDPDWHPDFGGTWSLTAYCNEFIGGSPGGITAIHPYAAYDVTDMTWAVKPPHLPDNSVASLHPAVVQMARAIAAEARAVLRLDEPLRTREARSLWDRIHADRSAAFSEEGSGWADPGNIAEKWLAYAPHGLLGKIRDLAMARTAAQVTGPLYHGSMQEYPRGAVLTPEGRDPDGSIHSGDYVYATTNPDAARYFASTHDTSPMTDQDVHIHRVEPAGDVEPDEFPAAAEDERFREGNYRAKALRVVDHYQTHGHWAPQRKTAAADPDRFVTCGQGHQHWGALGAAGLLIRHKGDDGQHRYLLQKRSPHVDHGGTWSTPGGALQHGETPEEGAVREASEEGMDLPDGLVHHHTFSDDHGGWKYHTVVMDSPHRFDPSGEGEPDWESSGHGWFTPHEVKGLPLHPGFAASWDKVRKSGAVQKTAVEEPSAQRSPHAMEPHAQAAQDHVRLYHPGLVTRLNVKNNQGSIVLSKWLGDAGHPRAAEAYVTRHPDPDAHHSAIGRGLDGAPIVALHPDRWDYGTLAHEAAHLITDHQTGRLFGHPHGPDGAHGDQWAGNYAGLLNRISKGAGDDFLEQREAGKPMHREAAAEEVLYHSGGRDFPGSEEWLHLGTRKAALDRAADWKQERERRGEPAPQVYLHHVRLHGARQPLTPERDEVVNQPGIGSYFLQNGYTAVPYVNEHEDPGSTSYLTHHSAVQLVKTEPLGIHREAAAGDGPWYHGTRTPLSAGDAVLPASKHGRPVNWGDTSDTDFAHATSSMADAAEFGHTFSGRGREEVPVRVFQVRPAGETEVDPKADRTGIRSRDGFHIVREVPEHEWRSAMDQGRAEYAELIRKNREARGLPGRVPIPGRKTGAIPAGRDELSQHLDQMHGWYVHPGHDLEHEHAWDHRQGEPMEPHTHGPEVLDHPKADMEPPTHTEVLRSQRSGPRDMPVSEALNLRSGDWGGRVGDHLDDIRDKIGTDYEDGGEGLRARMESGHLPGGPLVVNHGQLDDGHRRLLTAHELGWSTVPVRSGDWGRREAATQLETADYEGTTGSRDHITRTERGMIPTSAVAQIPGARGEMPGDHANRQGRDWEDFKRDIAENGIRNPLFVTVDHGQDPKLSEGNHRRDAAVELGLSHVPAEIRYYGHAEQQGTVLDRARMHREAAAGPEPESWYHITDNPHFSLDPHHEPEDNSISVSQRTGTGIYLTKHPESWVNGHGYVRPYVAEVHAHPDLAQHDTNGRYGSEMFVPSEHFDKLHVHRVIPLDAHAREEFHGYGWMEEHHNRDFETGEQLPKVTWKLPDHMGRPYRYSGPDVRDMSPEQHAQHRDNWLRYMEHNRGWTDPEDLDAMRESHDSHRKTGAAEETVDVYHHSDPEAVRSIWQGKRFEPADDENRVYGTNLPPGHKGMSGADYGSAAVHLRVPRSVVHQWPGRVDEPEHYYDIDADDIKPEHFVETLGEGMHREAAADGADWDPKVPWKNARQTMRVEDIGRMHSQNLAENTDGILGEGVVPMANRFRHGSTVEDWDRLNRAKGPETAKRREENITRFMREDGFDKDYPLEVSLAAGPEYSDVLHDGHNRYSSAKDAGLTHVHVHITPSYAPRSQWTPEDWEGHTAARGYDLKPRSGMIYLELPPGTVRPVPGGVDDHHITVCYLGKDVDDKGFAEACRRAKEAASQSPPLSGHLEGTRTFPPSEGSDNKTVAYVPAFVRGLSAVRHAVEDLNASQHKDYSPHVTLAYLEDGEPVPEPHPRVPVSFDELHVKRGSDVVSFPFEGGTGG
jgi:8-oxo-dGTP diphosphatase